MWSPSHVHVIVRKAEGLLIKGKNGTNNAFVVIELGKESYRTSVKEKSGSEVDWNEECELKIPKVGNSAFLVLTALHRNHLGLDQFLGTVEIPLVSFDKYQRSLEWYRLQGKPGKEKGKDKNRGELQVEVGFLSKVKSQSLTSLNMKKKNSLDLITGSLFGLSGKKGGVKKFSGTLGRIVSKKKKKNFDCDEVSEKDINVNNCSVTSNHYNNLDPGVISEDEDCASHRSSESLCNISENPVPPPVKPRRIFLRNPQINISHWEEEKPYLSSSLNVSEESVSSTASRRLTPKLGDLKNKLKEDRRLSSSCVDFSHLTSPKPQKKFSSSLYLETTSGESQRKLSKLARKLKSLHSADKKEIRRSVVDGCEANGNSFEDLTAIKSEFKHKNKDELIRMVVDLQKRVNCVSVRVKDLEDYLDGILLKVMETVPKILEKS